MVDRTTVRDYPYGSLAAHVLGYVGPVSDTQWAFLKDHNSKAKPYTQADEIGRAGVEATYEKYLRGTPGRQVFEVDRSGKVVREIEQDRVAPRAGDDLYLSIDVKVQFKAEEALQAQLLNSFQGRAGEEAGALVVNDPSTGQIRAMASYPTYDPRDLVGGISCPTWRDLQGLPKEGSCGKDMATEIKMLKKDDRAPVPKLLNRAIQGGYPPASTFKLASSYAMLKLGMRDPNTTIADPGYVRLCPGEAKGCVKQNANRAAHGYVNLRTALTVSSDVYYYTLGRDIWASRDRLGKDAFQQAVRELGYGAETGIDIPGESAGQIPDPKSEMDLAMALYKADPAYYENDPAKAKDAGRWNTGKSADIAIGQQLTATPLQTANAYASLANGGTLWRPTVIEKITAAGEPTKIHKRYEKHAIRRIDWGPNREDLIFGFRGVVDPSGQTYGGTAVTAFQGFPFANMPLAGKTGTAQTGEYKNKVKRPDNSVFVAFTLGGPEPLAATAMLEHSGSGAGAAAPVIRRTLEPIADGSLADFTVPKDGRIDAESVAQQLSPTGGGVD
ncbi:MAG: penicillin-binding transpeptidase domain-containing protein [Acidimicrobiales bacterium]